VSIAARQFYASYLHFTSVELLPHGPTWVRHPAAAKEVLVVTEEPDKVSGYLLCGITNTIFVIDTLFGAALSTNLLFISGIAMLTLVGCGASSDSANAKFSKTRTRLVFLTAVHQLRHLPSTRI
jgi:hypothetical protein